MTDFEINEDVIQESSVELIDEKMQEAVERIAIEREKLFAYALYEGYDGVDIYMDTSVVTDYKDYSMGFEYEAWEDDPPTIDRFHSNVQRYDFRMLSEMEKHKLLAKIGVLE